MDYINTQKIIPNINIPYPKLLTKDHKKINKKAEFPTRLVISATNFTETFSKLGHLGIKIMMDKLKVNY